MKPSGPDYNHPDDQRHTEFTRDADLVIHDTQYSEDKCGTKIGWGHNPLGYVRDLALAANVKNLVFFHHDPTHDDAWVDDMAREFKSAVAQQNPTMEVFTVFERMALEVQGHGSC